MSACSARRWCSGRRPTAARSGSSASELLPLSVSTPVAASQLPVMPFWLVKTSWSCPGTWLLPMAMVAPVRLTSSTSLIASVALTGEGAAFSTGRARRPRSRPAPAALFNRWTETLSIAKFWSGDRLSALSSAQRKNIVAPTANGVAKSIRLLTAVIAPTFVVVVVKRRHADPFGGGCAAGQAVEEGVARTLGALGLVALSVGKHLQVIAQLDAGKRPGGRIAHRQFDHRGCVVGRAGGERAIVDIADRPRIGDAVGRRDVGVALLPDQQGLVADVCRRDAAASIGVAGAVGGDAAARSTSPGSRPPSVVPAVPSEEKFSK